MSDADDAAKVMPQFWRVNFLIASAFVVVVVCIAVTVWNLVDDEFAKGIVTLVLGRFLGYIDGVYQFEFGTTRSSAKKDDTIRALTAGAAEPEKPAAGK